MAKTSTDDLLAAIIEGIQEKKGKNILSIDFKKINNALVRYYVICEGDSNTHVNAIADSITETVRKHKAGRLLGKDGYDNAEWLILDYYDIFVHIFQPQIREHYKIEELWADCPSKEYI